MKTPIKYAHPENHELCWSGRGQRPRWVTAYLAQGRSESALVSAAEAVNRGVTVTKTVPVVAQAQLPGLPPVPKKRGRPVTGAALTPAQRKRKSRELAATMVWGASGEGGKPLTEVPLSALLEQFARCFAAGLPATAKDIAHELTRRASLIKRD